MAGNMEPWAQSSEARFVEYVDALTTVLGRADRAGPLKDYCIGLLMPGERKMMLRRNPSRRNDRRHRLDATIRRQLTVALARTLTRCPCCQALPLRPPYRGSS